jgi:hypothetical protein
LYNYSIYGQEENTVLQHNKKFTKEEFLRMCEEVPKIQLFVEVSAYDSIAIIEHLKQRYGFKAIEYTAGLYID